MGLAKLNPNEFFAAERVFRLPVTSFKVRQFNVKMDRNRLLIAALAVALFASPPAPPAQDTPQTGQGQRGQFAGMQRVNGEVTAVNGSTLTIKNEDGVAYQVTVTDNTRIMKGRGETVKAADIKVGDGLVAMGNLDAPNKTLHAAMVMTTDAATLKQLKDNLGKTYIICKVKDIDVDNDKMTIERPDKVVQTITFDETPSFKRGGGMTMRFGAVNARPETTQQQNSGESITLADIKVGDNVTGEGSLKSGVFVPTQLMVATPGQIPRRNRDGSVPAVRLGTPARRRSRRNRMVF